MSKAEKRTFIEYGTVLSYNNDPNRRTPFAVNAGDKLEWKRNGIRGHANAKVVGFAVERPDHVFVENYCSDWSKPIEYRARVWIKKRSVSRVFTESHPTNRNV